MNPRGGRVLGAVVLLAVIGSLVPPAAADPIPTIYLYVNDLSSPGVLVADEEASLQNLCYEIDSRSTAEVAILVVNTTLPLGIDLFAARTFEANGIGKVGRDNGVLLVVSTDERLWRFEVGYGLEGILPDSKVGQIGRDFLDPALAVGDYYGGIWDATYAIGTEIVNNYDPGGPVGNPQPWVIDWRAIGIAIAIAVVLAVITKGRIFLILPNLLTRGRFGGGRSGGGGTKGRY